MAWGLVGLSLGLYLNLSPKLSLDLSLNLSLNLSLRLSLDLSLNLSLGLPLGLWASGWPVGVNHPFTGLSYALFANFLALAKKGVQKQQNWKTAQHKHLTQQPHHMLAILIGETAVFQPCRVPTSRKTKN